MVDIWNNLSSDAPSSNEEILSLARDKIETEDFLCSDYTLSDIDDGLDETLDEGSENDLDLKSFPGAATDHGSNVFNPTDNFMSGVTKADRKSSDSSGVSSRDSRDSQSGFSVASESALCRPNLDEGTDTRIAGNGADARPMLAAFESGESVRGGREHESRHNFEGVVRRRSMSQGRARESERAASSDKNNNNNEVPASRTLPRLVVGRLFEYASSTHEKRYNQAVGAYRNSSQKNDSRKVRSLTVASDQIGSSHDGGGEPINENVGRSPTHVTCKSKPAALIALPKQQPPVPPLYSVLDYKTILRRTQSSLHESPALVSPQLLQHIQNDAFLDMEDPDLVTDIDTILHIENGEAERTSGEGERSNLGSDPELKSPEKIVWSGLRVLAERKNLKTAGSFAPSFDEGVAKESNLRKNAIITKRNKSAAFRRDMQNSSATISSVGRCHTLARPGRFARISRSRKVRSADCQSTDASLRFSKTSGEKSSSQINDFLRVPSRTRDGSQSDDEDHDSEFLSGDNFRERRFSKSISDLRDRRQAVSDFSMGRVNRNANNNNVVHVNAGACRANTGCTSLRQCNDRALEPVSKLQSSKTCEDDQLKADLARATGRTMPSLVESELTDNQNSALPCEGGCAIFEKSPKAVVGVLSGDVPKLDVDIDERIPFLLSTPILNTSSDSVSFISTLWLTSSIFNLETWKGRCRLPDQRNRSVKRRSRRPKRQNGVPLFRGNIRQQNDAWLQSHISGKGAHDEQARNNISSCGLGPVVSAIGSDYDCTEREKRIESLLNTKRLEAIVVRPFVGSMSQNHGPSAAVAKQSSPHLVTTSIQRSTVQEETKKEKKSKKKGKKGKVTKADIGGPQDFKHVNHVGWDPNKGFDMDEVAPAYKDLFSQAGISDHQLQDKDTAQFIYDFIEKRGGVDAVTKSQSPDSGPPPPPPSRGPRSSDAPPPPPPPSRPAGPRHAASKGGAPPPPPSRSSHRDTPPPPPPGRGHRAPRPQPSMPPPAPGVPAPPPPPPPPSAPCAPPPPPMSTGRGGLLDQIQAGTSLKSAADRPASEPQDGRGDLLQQIRKGKQLRTVTADDVKDRPPTEDDCEAGLAGALARALQMREKAIQSSDSEDDDDDEFDDDAWD